jgi:hypothetical protein
MKITSADIKFDLKSVNGAREIEFIEASSDDIKVEIEYSNPIVPAAS